MKKGYLWGIIAALAIALAFVLGLQSCGNKAVVENNNKETTAKTSMATIDIKDGASEANTNYVVNGLHLYDPTSKDLEDYADGAEVPVGSRLCVFAYNRASEIHLTVKNGDETIADKDYKILENDKDVEMFTFDVKGDVTVTTRVINSKNAQGIATVHINDDRLAKVSEGDKNIETGDDIAFGSHNFNVTAAGKDITADIRVGENKVESRTVAAGQTGSFSDINVNGDVFFTFNYANAADKAEAEAQQKASADRNNDVLGKVGTGDPKVVLIDQTGLSGISFEAMYLDNNDNVHKINSGREYPLNLNIFALVKNTTSSRLKLTAVMNGNTIRTVYIDPKPANQESSNNGINIDNVISLTGDLTLRLEVDGGGNFGNAGNTGNQGNDPGGNHSGGNSSGGNNSGGNNSGGNNSGGNGENNQKTYTLHIEDGAAAANTDYAVNGLHVYDKTDPKLADYEDGAKIPAGKKITAFVYNKASRVHLTITNNGKTVVDKDYDILQSDKDVDWIEFNAEGDVFVKTRVISNVTPEPQPQPQPQPQPDPQPQPGPTVKKHKVTITDKVKDPKVNMTVGYINKDDQPVNISSGSEYDEGILVAGRIVNTSDKKLKLTVKSGGKIVSVVKIGAKPAGDDAAYGGYGPLELKKDQEWIIEEDKQAPAPQPKTYKFNNTDTAHIYEVAVDGKEVKNGGSITEGKHKITVTQADMAGNITLKVGNRVIGSHEFTGVYDTYDFTDVNVDGDVRVEFKEKPEEVTHKVTIENKVTDPKVSLTIGYIDADNKPVNVVSGQSYKEGTLIAGRVVNASDKKYKLTVKSGDQVVATVKIGAKPAGDDAAYGGYGPLELKKDQTWTLEEDVEPAPKTKGRITIKDGAKEANTAYAVNGFHVYLHDDKDQREIASKVVPDRDRHIPPRAASSTRGSLISQTRTI